jgi:phosphatidylglycerol---prolipoprotein diacylglyceryl transferase
MCPVFYTFHQFHLFSHSFGPFYIHAYGVMLAAAFLCGLMLLVREAKAAGLFPEDMIDMTIFIIILSVIGGRVLYVLLSMDEYSAHPLSAMKIYEGGLSFHGGAIGGFLAAFLFAWRRKLPIWKIIDAGIPGLTLGAAIARWGCFLNGCCYGREWHGPWAIVFPALQDHLPRHPAQLYDSFLNLTLLALLFYLKRFRRKQGDMFGFYLMGFAILRFITEIFRAGVTGKLFMGTPITMAQAASLLIFAVGLAFYLIPANKIPGTFAMAADGSPAPTPDSATKKPKAKPGAAASDKKNKPPKKKSQTPKKQKR